MFVNLNNLEVVLKAEITEVKRVSGHLRCSNIYSMLCINYRSVNVGREHKAFANKTVLVCIY